jgi:LPPG:FO 2-phospho-L-lactate transferase
MQKGKVVALSGGVGGAKLALGLARQLPPDELLIVCNTGDDFEHLGLSISPDLDTVMYTLAGISHPGQGWGLADESWRVMSRLEEISGPSWFRLGDLDLATHLYRSQRLREGAPLSLVTHELCERLGVTTAIIPATDDMLRTQVETDNGALPFQHYFVRERCQPVVRGLQFEGAQEAKVLGQLGSLLQEGGARCIVLCPSNPFLSIAPILCIPGLQDALRKANVPVIAVSPIVAGKAIKGPTAKMMGELGLPVTATGVADYYRDLIDGIIIDQADVAQTQAIETMSIAVHTAQTVMRTLDDKRRLADHVIRFAHELASLPNP